MQVVMLAGGFGSRLAGEVKDVPKPLAPVAGRPFLEYLIEQLRDQGQTNFIFCLHHKADKIMEHFGNGSRWGISIQYSLEEKPLGTGGALGLVGPLLNETFWVVNADTYLECDLNGMLAHHRRYHAKLTMALAQVAGTSRFGRVRMEPGGRLLGFAEKQPEEGGEKLVNAGLYLMEPDVLDLIPPRRPVPLEKYIIPMLIAEKSAVYGYTRVSNFFDIGVPEDYYAFQNWVATHKTAREVESSTPMGTEENKNTMADIAEDDRGIERRVGEAILAISSLQAQRSLLDKIAHIMAEALKNGNRIYLCGNGGSAADAQHLAAELAGRFMGERLPLPAVALTTNTSVLTAIANDYGYDEVFVRQVQALVGSGDIVVGISTSGNSTNVVRAIEEARSRGAVTIAFTGAGGRLREIADLCLQIPADDTPRIQEAHITAGHIICGLIEEELFGGTR